MTASPPRRWLAAALAMALIAAPLDASLPGDAVRQQIAEERAALTRARAAVREASTRSARMSERAATLRTSADRARVTRAALALRIQAAEARLAEVSTRAAVLAAARTRQQARLVRQQRPIAELLAALQLLSRRPPVSLFFQPGAASDIVHTRAMLEVALPVIRRRTAALRAEIAVGRRLADAQRRVAAEAVASAAALAVRRADLARSEAAARARSLSLAGGATLEGDRAVALGESAADIGVLIGRLEAASARRDRLARLAGPVARPGSVGGDAPRRGLFAATPAPPAFRLPVLGRVVQGFGEISGEGTRSRGITIAAQPGAQVVAPAGGRIVYAGPFRSFGRIVIVDHGDGWASLVTGLLTASGRVGDSVEQGSPIGRAGGANPRIGIELRRRGRPIDAAALAI